MSPRGVRFLAGNSGPARPASSTDEKKGKSGSIHAAHGLAAELTDGCWFADPRDTSPYISAKTIKVVAARQDFIRAIL
jgi:hypothetical protein